MSKGRKQKRTVPKSKLNGHAAPILPAPPRRFSPAPTPARTRLAMAVTIAIVVIALIGVVLETGLSDVVTTALKGPPGGHGQQVDGIPCDSSEQLTYHVHAHLTILDNGQLVTIPANTGITGSCFYWLHTHDTTGVIHIEAPVERPFTLSQFFDIWGQTLTDANVAGHHGAVTAYVDQKPYTGDIDSIPLKDHESITLEVGTTTPPPANYDFGDLP